MRALHGLCAAALAAAPLGAQATLVVAVPAATPPGATVFVAGGFNAWNPADSAFRLTRRDDGRYAVTLPADVRGPVEFKFTLGSWDRAELDGAGRDAPNRRFTVPDTGAATYEGAVAAWRNGAPRAPRLSTASPSVAILDSAFAIPQLGRTRRVWIYLPPDYRTSRRRYPVLYLQDGQNVFDAKTSYAGEWGVDETLDSLYALGARDAIVVAVDHGGAKRFDEYSPWKNPKYGGGEGDRYVDFLVHTLKPYVDAHYRTLPDRAHTGIAGSSMGGLIALYAGLAQPGVFGRIGVFSPAFWVTPQVYAFARRARPRAGTRIYMVMGGEEGDTPAVYVHDAQLVRDSLVAAGFTPGRDLEFFVRPDGRHAEWFWRREFPAAYEWLFGDRPAPARPPAPLAGAGTSWTRGAVCYEVFVRSFYDSNGDGIGDLNGLTAKLDYIRGLGASCVWLMPIAASPSYHGYDVSDYFRVDPAYGTNVDFQRFVAAAHARGIRVLVDMVLNHTSDRNPWFLSALADTASPYRSWYRFSPTPLEARGPWGQTVWHRSPVRDEYYYGVFAANMPDLNYDTPAVRLEAMKIADYWLREMGVDGFRLDAVQYLAEAGECMKDCAGTHAFLHAYAAHVDSVRPGAYTIGEVWDPLDTLLTYYPDQLTSYFTFALKDSLVTALRRGTVGGMFDDYLKLQDTLPDFRWSPLLSNHDGTRIMTLVGGDFACAKQAATLLLTLPGLPFIYYGEEIGMTGDKPDPRIRTPMQWRPGTGGGFTTGTPWEPLQPDSQTTTVAAEDLAPKSLLNLYRRLIHLRKATPALAAGRLVRLATTDPHVAAYLRVAPGAGTGRAGARGGAGAGFAVLVVANLDSAALTGVTLSTAGSSLAPGTYAARDLLTGTLGAALTVGTDGRISAYVPARALAPRETLVLALARR